MSSALILVVMVLYFITGVDLYFKGQLGLSLTFVAYAISNIGLYLVSRGI